MTPTIRTLVDDGYTWEEADALLSGMAEDQIDDARDREAIEYYEMLEHARELENFDGRA